MKEAWKWDYSGHYSPGTYKGFQPLTFSLGIFQWIPRASDNSKLKRSAVAIRVVGYTSNPEPATKKAEEICEQLNAGKPVSEFKKRIKIKETG